MVESKDKKKDVFANIASNFSTQDIRSVYKFTRVLGTGHFGTVRLGAPKTDEKNVVGIKSILKESIKKDIKNLEEELFIMAQVDHPNIIKFHESYLDHKYVHIVMEYCSGGELFDHIVKHTNFTEGYASKLMKQMISSIKHLHE
jgi:calcium-dependent protein kinase